MNIEHFQNSLPGNCCASARDTDWKLVGQLYEADRVLARHYGFREEELDFILHYDIKYRLGKGAEA